MSNYRHLENSTFGRLTVLHRARTATGFSGWKCRCECGNETIVLTGNLTKGHTTSCGCYRLETNGKATITHGMSRTREYCTFNAMHKRCTDPKDKRFDRYGGRGITVCKRWQSFENFYADMGDKPKGHSLDRIDNNKGYSPSNCRWATPQEQSRNRSTTRLITINGTTKCLREWCDHYGKQRTVVYGRLKRGWSLHDAITQPLRGGA